MPTWIWFAISAAVALVVLALVWWSSGRAPVRRYSRPDADELARNGMIETDALPARTGFIRPS